MQEIKLCRLEKWIGEKDETTISGKGGLSDAGSPCVIVGVPCKRLLDLENAGYCVLAELTHLQGLPEEEVAEALCREEAVQQFEHVCIDASELPQGYLRRIWCKSQALPVVIAKTGRLLIRESIVEDAEAFAQLYQDEACRKYLELPQAEDYRHYIENYRNGQYAFYEYGMWTVIEKESGAVVGRAGLEQQEFVREEGDANGAERELENDEAENVLGLGYAILPEYRGRGYAVEACLAILEYCKECEYADRVTVTIDKENLASRKVFDKLQEKACMPLELIFK